MSQGAILGVNHALTCSSGEAGSVLAKVAMRQHRKSEWTLPRGQGAYYRTDLAPANTIERSWTNNGEVRKVWLRNNARGKDQLETNPPKGQKYLEGAKNISVGT